MMNPMSRTCGPPAGRVLRYQLLVGRPGSAAAACSASPVRSTCDRPASGLTEVRRRLGRGVPRRRLLGECRVKLARATSSSSTGRSGEHRAYAIVVDRVAGPPSQHRVGRVRLGQIDGTAVIKNSNGDSWIGAAAGDLRVNAANGSISVDHANADVTQRQRRRTGRRGHARRHLAQEQLWRDRGRHQPAPPPARRPRSSAGSTTIWTHPRLRAIRPDRRGERPPATATS